MEAMRERTSGLEYRQSLSCEEMRSRTTSTACSRNLAFLRESKNKDVRTDLCDLTFHRVLEPALTG